MMIHQTDYFELPDQVLPLPPLVEEHEKANPDSDQRIVRNCEIEISYVLFEPNISQTSEKKEAKTDEHTSHWSGPTRSSTDHGGMLSENSSEYNDGLGRLSRLRTLHGPMMLQDSEIFRTALHLYGFFTRMLIIWPGKCRSPSLEAPILEPRRGLRFLSFNPASTRYIGAVCHGHAAFTPQCLTTLRARTHSNHIQSSLKLNALEPQPLQQTR